MDIDRLNLDPELLEELREYQRRYEQIDHTSESRDLHKALVPLKDIRATHFETPNLTQTRVHHPPPEISDSDDLNKNALKSMLDEIAHIDEQLKKLKEEQKVVTLHKKELIACKKQLSETVMNMMEQHELDEVVRGDLRFKPIYRHNKGKSFNAKETIEMIKNFVSNPGEAESLIQTLSSSLERPETRRMQTVRTARKIIDL